MCIHMCCVIASIYKGLLYLFSCSAIPLGRRITAIKSPVQARFPVCWLAFFWISSSVQNPPWCLMWSEVCFRSVSFRVNNLTEPWKEAIAIFPFSTCELATSAPPGWARNQVMKQCSGRQGTASWWHGKIGACFSCSDSALAINVLTGQDR